MGNRRRFPGRVRFSERWKFNPRIIVLNDSPVLVRGIVTERINGLYRAYRSRRNSITRRYFKLLAFVRPSHPAAAARHHARLPVRSFEANTMGDASTDTVRRHNTADDRNRKHKYDVE